MQTVYASVKGLMRGRAGGLMNGSVSGACQQICGDVLWDAHFLLSLFVLRSLLRRASATDNYRQFKLGHSTVRMQRNQLPPPQPRN